MAQSKCFFDDVKKELECSVCQEQFTEIKEPKILKCLHTFCTTCLEAWLRQQREGQLSCPTCRHITKCPNNDINNLPSNLFCKQLVEIVEAYSGQGQEDSPQCGNCDERKSLKFYCSNCNCFLCEDCAAVHMKVKLFRGHIVKEIENFESSDVQDYARSANVCKKHKDEVRFLCLHCQICICRDCALLEHQDHKRISVDQGLENIEPDIEAKIREVQANGSRLKTHKETMEKRKLKLSSDIEEARREVKRVAERCILMIRQHEASVTESLVKQKGALDDAFAAQMTSLEGKMKEIDSTLAFCEEVLFRKNLPELLNVKALIEQRLQELSVSGSENMPKLDISVIKYVPNDCGFLKDAPGKLITSNTEPLMSVGEGKGLMEGTVDDDCSFTVITKNSAGKTTYSEIDEVNVAIISLTNRVHDLKLVKTDLNDGRYSVSYRPTTPGKFTVSVEVAGTAIVGSPFALQVKGRKSLPKKKLVRGIKDTPDSNSAAMMEGNYDLQTFCDRVGGREAGRADPECTILLRWLVPVFSFPTACNFDRIGQKEKPRPMYHFCRVGLYNLLLTKYKCCFVISGFHDNVCKG